MNRRIVVSVVGFMVCAAVLVLCSASALADAQLVDGEGYIESDACFQGGMVAEDVAVKDPAVDTSTQELSDTHQGAASTSDTASTNTVEVLKKKETPPAPPPNLRVVVIQ